MKRFGLPVLFLIAAIPLFAGDVASFVNLGFSPDSAYFMYGQFGIESSTSQPWAELGVIDTKRNEYLPKGRIERSYPGKIAAGQSAVAGLFPLYADAAPLVRLSRVDPLASGRLLYALVEGAEVPQKLEFRDFASGDSWQIAINKTVAEAKDGVKSSFGLAIARSGKDGSSSRATAGTPALQRSGVKDYTIRSVWLAPDAKTLAIVIEKTIDSKGDISVRYMVETAYLP